MPEADAKKLFYSTTPDIEYLSRIIYDWLVKNDRLGSKKYLVGESYGGFRGPRVTHYLQSQLGVAMNGVVLVSPYLNPTIEDDGDLSPLPWMMTLPSITAAHLERENKLTPQAMADVIAYTRGEYATTLLKGRSDPDATQKMIQRVTELTGLDPAFVKYSGGRLETEAYLREVFREQGKLGSVYDSNVTSFDPFPFSPEQRANDPILATMIAPMTTAMVDFVTRTVGWKVDARYNALSYEVNRLWDRGDDLRKGAVPRFARGCGGRPQAAGADRAWLERSLLPLYGLDSDRGSDAGDGRSYAGISARVSGRAYVLYARGKPGGTAQGCDGDVRQALIRQGQGTGNGKQKISGVRDL